MSAYKGKVSLVTSICLMMMINLLAQPLRFQSYTTSQGLSQNSVYSITQTADKFIWFGTQDGLNRFDGMRFVQITPKIDDLQQMRFSKMFTALMPDPKDMLWAGTSEGLVLYDRFINQFKQVQRVYKGFKPIGTKYISQLMVDEFWRMWILSQDGKVVTYDIKEDKMITLPDLPFINCISTDNNGNIFLAGNEDVFSYQDHALVALQIRRHISTPIKKIVNIVFINDALWAILNGNELYEIKLNRKNAIDKIINKNKEYKNLVWPADMRLLHSINRNNIWIGSRSHGLIKLNESNKTYSRSSNSNITNSLRSQFVLSIFTDQQGLTWIGESLGGIAKYDNANTLFELYHIDRNKDGSIADNSIFSIYSPNDIDFYSGTLIGGLLHQNIKSGDYTYYLPDDLSNQNSESKNIYSILPGDKNLLWLATWGGLYSFNTQNKKFQNHSLATDIYTTELYTVYPMDPHTLLVGSNNGGLKLFDTKKNIWLPMRYSSTAYDSLDFVVRYITKQDNYFYLATEKKNLIELDVSSGTLKTFSQFEKISSTARHILINDNILWIATDNGLIQANLKDKSIIKLWNTTNGLPNDVIYTVIDDDYDYIWLSSNDGISKIYPFTGVVENYNENAGLQGKEFNTASGYKDQQGNIWMGGVNGMNKIKPVMETPISNTSTPMITAIKVMNADLIQDTLVSYVSHITLPYNKNMINLEFQALDYSQTENIDYESKMDGIDSGWVKLGKRNYLSFTQLKPGTYTLHLRANNINQRLSQLKTLKITIKSPWYQTGWFRLLFFTTLIALIYQLYLFRVNQLISMERMRQRISADLHDDIGASLTTLSVLSKMASFSKNDNSLLDKYLSQISEQANHVTDSLRDIVWSIQPQNDKLQNLVDRMKKFSGQILDTKGIDFSFNEQEVKDKNLPLDIHTRQNIFLIFKEILNNMVKHANASHAHISLRSTTKDLTMNIKDDGIGFDESTIPRGNGLNNMRQRAEKLNGTFSIQSTKNEGTTIECSFPLNYLN